MILREATLADAPAIAAIYAHHVLHGFGTFEETPPSAEEMAQRMAEVSLRRLPWLAAEEGGVVLGYAYASPFRLRSAYRYTVEDSVYVAADSQGRGVGRSLLRELIARCEALGIRQMLAVIGDSANAASIALHAAEGFEMSGVTHAVGYKAGRWVDIVSMQRELGLGASAPPSGTGIL
ncbi:MAG TPA: GNAT family N-acetyltransferase [Caulobacteraceae bacterium]|nr:GNAT family N-acetyltransferase [Caulobacteraceae bacterium]